MTNTITRHIPNFLTLCNLFCGVWATIFAFEGNYTMTAYFFLAGIVFDFFDGFTARILHVKSELGKELDSLADLVTSGLAPSMVLFSMLKELGANNIEASVAFIVVCFSALRLAKFNLDVRQSESFIGLPTPANGLILIFLPFLAQNQYLNFINNYWVILTFIIICSFLLVSELKLFSLKFKNFTLQNNGRRYVLIFITIFLLILLNFSAFPIIVLIYILLSFLPKKQIGDKK